MINLTTENLIQTKKVTKNTNSCLNLWWKKIQTSCRILNSLTIIPNSHIITGDYPIKYKEELHVQYLK